MALSGSFATSAYISESNKKTTLVFAWTATQSIASNTSTITWTLKGDRGGASGYLKSGNFKVVIAGETVYSTGMSDRIELRDGTLITSGTYSFTHADDGSKSFTVSVQGGVYTYDVNVSGSQTFTLDTIPRKSELSVSDGTLTQVATLTVTRKSTAFTHSISYRCGTATGTICTKSSSTSIGWTPPIELAEQNPSGSYVVVEFTISTYQSSTLIGSITEAAKFYIPASIGPVIAYTSSDSAGYATKYGAYVQGKSKLRLNFDPGTYSAYGAWITSCKTEFDGKTYTTMPVVTGVISGTGELTIKVTVTDSRGRTATTSSKITVLAYEPPKITDLSSYRCDASGAASSSGEYLAIKFSTQVKALNNKNKAEFSVSRMKNGDTKYTEVDASTYKGKYSVTNGILVFPAETSSSYDIQFSVYDDFYTASKSVTGPSVKKVWSLLKKAGDIVGVAFGKVAELEDVFDISMQSRFLGGILHPVLPTNADLNEELTPKTYMMLSANTYSNVPESGVGAFLEIVGMKDASLIQRINIFDKTNPRAYERIHYSTTGWGEWICVRGDFVVAQGETNGWTWRKWNSGVAECWKILTHKTTITTAWGTLYHGTATSRQSYPFTFTGKPTEQASLTAGSYQAILFPEKDGNGVNGAAASACYNVCRPSSLTSTVEFYISISVKGKWK